MSNTLSKNILFLVPLKTKISNLTISVGVHLSEDLLRPLLWC